MVGDITGLVIGKRPPSENPGHACRGVVHIENHRGGGGREGINDDARASFGESGEKKK